MKTPFRLEEHPPRRSQPLASPPDRYFDTLPLRVMQRVQPTPTDSASVWSWLMRLPAPLRTTLASVLVLGGFAASFFLNQPAAPAAPTVALAAVPQTELVQYLLANESRVTLTDLAELPDSDQLLTENYLHVSPSELQDALDAQPSDDTYL